MSRTSREEEDICDRSIRRRTNVSATKRPQKPSGRSCWRRCAVPDSLAPLESRGPARTHSRGNTHRAAGIQRPVAAEHGQASRGTAMRNPYRRMRSLGIISGPLRKLHAGGCQPAWHGARAIYRSDRPGRRSLRSAKSGGIDVEIFTADFHLLQKGVLGEALEIEGILTVVWRCQSLPDRSCANKGRRR